MKIGIIGAGNMGLALAKGILLSGEFSPEEIVVSDRNGERLKLARKLGLSIAESNSEVVESADVIFLAVKPGVVGEVLREICEKVKGKLLISVAAAVSIDYIESICEAKVIRLMPNICAEVGQMVACYSLGSRASKRDEKILLRVLRGAGILFRIEEELMDAATALCGSGPAFFLRIIEAVEKAAVELGFDGQTAAKIVPQIAKGAAELATREEPKKLIEKICTPGGTTEEGMKILDKGKIEEILKNTFKKATEKSRKISEQIEVR